MADSASVITSKNSEKSKLSSLVNRTTSETLRLNDIEKVVSSPNSLSTNAPRKKTSFQITSVIVGSRASNDGGDDSADDLDESHAEDISEVLDNSRITDLENETPSYSEDTFSKDDVFFNASSSLVSAPVIPTSSQYGLAIVATPEHSESALNPSDHCENCDTVDVSSVDVTENVINLGVVSTKHDPEMRDMHPPAPRTERFKVVKIESTEPFKRGRWVCMDYLDHNIAQKDQPSSKTDIADNTNTTTEPSSTTPAEQTVVVNSVVEEQPLATVPTEVVNTPASTMQSNENSQVSNQVPISSAPVIVPNSYPSVSPGQSLQSSMQMGHIVNSSTAPVVTQQSQSLSQVHMQQILANSNQHQSLQPQQMQQVLASANVMPIQQPSSIPQNLQQQPVMQQPIQQMQQMHQQTQQYQSQPQNIPQQQQSVTQQQTIPQQQQQSLPQQQQQSLPQQQQQSLPQQQQQSLPQQQQTIPQQQQQQAIPQQQQQQQTIPPQQQVLQPQQTMPQQQQTIPQQQQTIPQQQQTMPQQQQAMPQQQQTIPQQQQQTIPQQQQQTIPQQQQQTIPQQQPMPQQQQTMPQQQQTIPQQQGMQQQMPQQQGMPQQQQPMQQQQFQPIQQQQAMMQQQMPQQPMQSQMPVQQVQMQPGVQQMPMQQPQGQPSMQQQPMLQQPMQQLQQQQPTQMHQVSYSQPPLPNQTTQQQVPGMMPQMHPQQMQGFQPGQMMTNIQPQPIMNIQSQPHLQPQYYPVSMSTGIVTSQPGLMTQGTMPQGSSPSLPLQTYASVASMPPIQVPNMPQTPPIPTSVQYSMPHMTQTSQMTLPPMSMQQTMMPQPAQQPPPQQPPQAAQSYAGISSPAQSYTHGMSSSSVPSAIMMEQPLINGEHADNPTAALIESLNEVTAAADEIQPGEDAESTSGANAVAIDNKIEQAMDLVKSHLMYAVREEVEVLKEKIAELMDRIGQLEAENATLRAGASPETLALLPPTAQNNATNNP